MTKRAAKVEAWAAVFSESTSQCERDSVFFNKESAAYVAKLHEASVRGPTRVAHLVEVFPLETRLLKAAMAFGRYHRGSSDDEGYSLRKLLEACEALRENKR